MSAIVRFWYYRVKDGVSNIEDVPLRWREQVRELIDKEIESN
jgi:hypothetical protein